MMPKLASIWRSMPLDQKNQYYLQADQLRKELLSEKAKIFADKTKEEVKLLKKEVRDSRSQRKKHLSDFRIKKVKTLEPNRSSLFIGYLREQQSQHHLL